MEARNAAAHSPVSEGSLGAGHGSGNPRLRELAWKSLPCVKLPLPPFRGDEAPLRVPKAACDWR